MSKFNFNRFKMVAKWDALTNRQAYLRGAFGLAIGLSIFCIVMLYTLYENWYYNPTTVAATHDTFMKSTALSALIIASVGYFCFVGNCFHNMKTKLGRETYLMLPASNLEKYLGRFFNISVGGFILCWIAFTVADFIQFLFSFIIPPGLHGSLTLCLLSSCMEFKELPISNTIGLIAHGSSTFIFVHAFYTLGSTFFRKYALQLTTCAGLLLIYINLYIFHNNLSINLVNETDDFFCYNRLINAAILLILSAICYLSSYKIFTRMQVINNKWINI